MLYDALNYNLHRGCKGVPKSQPTQWYFHISNEQKVCPIQGCNNLGVVLGWPEDQEKQVEFHKKRRKKRRYIVEDCPKHQERFVFATQSALDTHTLYEHTPINLKSCRVESCSEFKIEWKTKAAHKKIHLQDQDPYIDPELLHCCLNLMLFNTASPKETPSNGDHWRRALCWACGSKC